MTADAAKREAMAAVYVSDAAYLSLHAGDPGLIGENELTGGDPAYARVPISWTAGDTDGVYTASVYSDFNVPPATDITHAGLWTAATGGTFIDSAPLTLSFAAQGRLTISMITFTQG